ncbi:hypothetical protein [uncultured Thiocystis sp.]|jgi:hypothetical protein|uniref:hypothetical protein n=1 Tax=uncultured Thiocystis sp. TaxID=1202134 RepID=UPI0025DFCE77|nr:hypothetical protein [uncultured Thiocystis sp.]
MASSIFAFTASRLKLAPFYIGGNSMAFMASFAISRWIHAKPEISHFTPAQSTMIDRQDLSVRSIVAQAEQGAIGRKGNAGCPKG